MKFLILLSIIAFASSSPVAQDESVFRLFLGNIVSCVNSDLGLCLKEQALKVTERLGSVRQLKLSEGLTILNNGPKESKSLELSAEPEARKKQITERLWESTSDLLKNSDLEVSFNTDSDDDESRALDDVQEGRGKKKEIKKKLKILVPLLLLAKAKAVALVIGSLVVIAASVFKIAVLAKIAFLVKAIIALKALLHKKHHHEEEHGWIEHHEEPHHVHVDHGHGWDGGWSRSRNEANNLAYSAYSK